MDSRPLHSISLIWRIALLVVLLGVSMAFLSPRTMLGRFGVQLSYDASHTLAGSDARVAETSEVVLVYLDMESHLREKQSPSSPWDRSLHARLIERLTRAGARTIVFDIIFQDPGTEAVDSQLTAALQQSGRVILAAEIARSSHEPGTSTGLRSQSLVLPLDRFLKAAAGIGLANVIPDEDFVVRRAYEGSASHQQPSLTEAVSRRLQLPAPTTPDSPAWIRYYGRPLALPHVSYSNALDPDGTPDEVFRDRIVFVGARPLTSGFTERRDEF